MLHTQERPEGDIAGVIDPEALLCSVQRLVDKDIDETNPISRGITSETSATLTRPAPKFRLNKSSVLPEVAAGLVRQLLALDGKPELNLASFVTTHIDKEGARLCVENITKNLADGDEYPALMEVHQRCVSILSHLWNVPAGDFGEGTATTGSSEAICLGGLAMKRRWEARQKAKGRPYDKPNIIMGANAQVALEKFARYFDVESKLLDVHADAHFSFRMDDLKAACDENTIGVFVILGSTYTGHYQNVKEVAAVLDEVEKEHGWDIPIHVDGASGAMVAPFCSPQLEWDFRVPRVKSINTSGHKFGLAPVGCGWVVWRNKSYLPQSLLFTLQYLGGSETTYTLNFSRPGHPIVYQYYEFIKRGYDGFYLIQETALKMARLLSIYLENSGFFDVYSDVHRRRGEFYAMHPQPSKLYDPKLPDEYYNDGLPVVSFGFNEKFKKANPEIPQEAVSALLRTRGYIIPNYPMPQAESKLEVLRVVVNPHLTLDFVDQLMEDIVKVVDRLVELTKSRGEDQIKVIRETLATISTAGHDEIEHEAHWGEAGVKRYYGRC